MSGRCRLALVVAVAALLAPAALALARGAAPEPRARVAQLAELAGCVQDQGYIRELLDEDETAECATGRALLGATGAAVSPDGRQVYVAAAGSDAITWLSRNGDTGQLTFAGCVSDDGGTGLAGTDGQCADGDAVDSPRSVAVSPDGAHVYAVTASAGAVLSFARDADSGRLDQLGCIRDHVEEGRCVDRHALGGARAITVAPDGEHVYAVSSGSDSVVALERDASTGRLTFSSCTSDDGTNGLCTDGEALRGATGVTVSPDGASVYVAASTSGAVLSFRRDPDTGALTQTGCELDDAPPGPCDRASALARAGSVAVAPDGGTVFATALEPNAVSTFRRDTATGTLTEAGCLAPEGTQMTPCAQGGLNQPTSVAVGPASGELIVSGAQGSLVSFAFDPGSASLTRTSCVTTSMVEGCTAGRGLAGAAWVAVAPDGRGAYVAAPGANAIAAFGEGAAVPARSAVVRRGVVQIPLACPRRARGGCRGVLELSPARRAAGAVVRRFRVRAGRSERVALRLPPRFERVLLRRRRLSATVTIRERGRALPPLARDFVLQAGEARR
jgi:DNA-binding beta-propeller fold protein YncE